MSAARDASAAGPDAARILVVYSTELGGRFTSSTPCCVNGQQLYQWPYDVAKLVRPLGIAVDPVWLPATNSNPAFPADPLGEGPYHGTLLDDAVLKLASETGGEEFRGQPTGAGFLSQTIPMILKQLDHEYVAGFVAAPAGNKEHKVQVVLRTKNRGEVQGGFVVVKH